MANKTKITQEIAKQITNLVNNNINVTQIAKKLGIGRTVVTLFCKNNNLNPTKRTRKGQKEKIEKYIKILKETGSPKKAKELSDIKSNGQYIIKKYNLQGFVRDKSFNKLSFEEATSRIPGNDMVVGFKNGKYKILTEDGFVYYKSSTKLEQGDPRGKSGRVQTEVSIANRLDKLGYRYIQNTFVDTHTSLKAVCKKCKNIRETKIHLFKIQECASCSNSGISKQESEINEWIKSLQLHTEKLRFKGKTRGKEVDIYIPELNIGIEYCGLYWHHEKSPTPRDRNYHYEKYKLCKEQDIQLITIFEDEWLEREKQIKGFILSKLNKNNTRIYARKCEIREVEKVLANKFLNENHIQGKVKHKIAFGLYYENELVGLVSGDKHHRQNQEGFVLNRLVFKAGISIVGGASKLTKALVNYAKNNGYNKLISWSDNRISNGNVYETTGWTKVEELRPDYSYYVGNCKRKSKQSCQKKNLLKLGATGNTEKEMADSLGYARVWDCGKIRWEIYL
jgi:hypothetical protein